MNKAEAREKIKEQVKYLLDTDDNDVAEVYTITLMSITEQYADEQSREEAVKFTEWNYNGHPFKLIFGEPIRNCISNHYDKWKSKK